MQKLALAAAQPALEAERVLAERGGSMSADELFDWVLQATNNQERAERAFCARRKAELKSGQPIATE